MGFYESYLKSEHWQNIKVECLISKQFEKCKICGKKRIQIHHLHYRNKFNEDIFKDLVPLCGKCHKMVHDKLKAEKIKSQTMSEFNTMFVTPTYKKTKKERQCASRRARRKMINKRSQARWERRQERKRIQALANGEEFIMRKWEDIHNNNIRNTTS